MKITIEDDKLVYIYLLKRKKREKIIDITHPCVEGYLIYDEYGSWIGLRLNLSSSDQDDITKYEINDEFECKVLIEKNDQNVSIRFDNGEKTIGEIREQDFNVDVIGNEIYGIEIIIWLANDIKKRIIPVGMIEFEK